MRVAAGLFLLGAAAVLLTVTLFFGGGSGDERIFWIGLGALPVALGALTASFAGWLPRPVPGRVGVAALGLVAALVAWIGLTMWWSIAADRSWDYLNRGLVYLAFAVIGLYVGALCPRPARTVATGLAILLFGVCGWALLGKVFPGLFPDGERVARLRNPVGYWNGLALLAATALPLYLWAAAQRRVLGAIGLYTAIVALLLTYSRGGALVALVAVAAWLYVGIERHAALVALASAVPVALAVGGIALALPGVSEDLQPRAVREADGGWFALALVLGAVVVALLARRELGRRELRSLAGAVAALVAVGVVALAAQGDWLAQLRDPDAAQVTQSPNRLSSTSSNNRWTWWKEAWELFEHDPAGGSGAATFSIARRDVRDSSIETTEPHSVPFQLLAETGVVGLLLGGAAAGAGVLGMAFAARRLEGAERGAASALALAGPIYLLHALADIDWDIVALSAPLFFVLGVLLGAAAPPRRAARRPVLALVAGLATLAALYAITAPWLAERRIDDVYRAIGRDDLPAALSAAREANDLNPLSPEPHWAAAAVYEAAGDVDRAVAEYERAAILQPEYSTTWYLLGAYELQVGRYERAYRDLDWAYGLDPYGPAGKPGGLLDQAREKAGGGTPEQAP
jgi:hypothetical protein